MNKALSGLGCSLAALCLSAHPSAAQSARPFQDVPTNHFAYALCVDLQRQGVVTGYPDNYFQGLRTLTRYEFAVAIKRALDAPLGDSPQSSLAQSIQIKRLVDEFQSDLKLLGVSSHDTDDALERRRAAIRDRVPRDTSLSGFHLPGLNSASGMGNALFSSGISAFRPSVSLNDLLLGRTPVAHPFGTTFSSDFGARTGLESPGPGIGLHVDLPISRAGLLGLTYRDLTGLIASHLQTREVHVYGAGLTVTPLPRFTLGAGLSRSISQQPDPASNSLLSGDNAIYRLHIGYRSGPADATVGYQVIDPNEEVPGMGLSTPLRGPFTRLAWQFSPSLRSYLGGDLYTLEHTDSTGAVLSPMNIYRGMAGVRWSPSRGFSLSADYEGVLYDLSGGASPSGHRPLEQYITLGAGLNLSRNAVLKMAYQIINQPDTSVGADNISGHGASSSVFSTQFAIHF